MGILRWWSDWMLRRNVRNGLATLAQLEPSSRAIIAQSIQEAVTDLYAKRRELDIEEFEIELLSLAHMYNRKRRESIEMGARNESHPYWAATALLQSWAQMWIEKVKGRASLEAVQRMEAQMLAFASRYGPPDA